MGESIERSPMETKAKFLRVGELARAVGKSVRAVHLYEELGLLRPVSRTAGGFRLFTSDAVDRINWITKLQAIGFSLSEIQGFVRDFENAESGRSAAARVRDVFQDKLSQIRNSLAQLRVIENDIVEALEYLESCESCAPIYSPGECRRCDHQGHERGVAPELFAGLSGVSPGVATPLPAAPAGNEIGGRDCAGLVGLGRGRERLSEPGPVDRGVAHEALSGAMDDDVVAADEVDDLPRGRHSSEDSN
ncbi:MAG TPA: MerR family transcriptional regulator [Kofleriaceae bacterium]|nr:MerR family transcriptional regulator [Kofleriaceae bacterium]